MIESIFLVFAHICALHDVLIIIFTECLYDSHGRQYLKLIHCEPIDLFNKRFDRVCSEEIILVRTFILQFLNAIEDVLVIVCVVSDTGMRLCADYDIKYLWILFF